MWQLHDWTEECSAIFAEGGDKELEKYLCAKEITAKVFGDPNYLINPVRFWCPIKSCTQSHYRFNGLSGIKHFYNHKRAHLVLAHADDPVAKRLLARLQAVDREGGFMLTSAELNEMAGCALKLGDKEWLEANLTQPGVTLYPVRPPAGLGHFNPDVEVCSLNPNHSHLILWHIP